MSKYIEMKRKKATDVLKNRHFEMININNLMIIENLGINSDVNLSDMTDELIEHSILSPISVIGPFKNGKYKIIDGARRYKAFKNINPEADIPCYVVGDDTVSNDKAKMLALSANKVKRNNDNSICLKYMEILNNESAEGNIEKRHIPAVFSELTGLTARQGRKYHKIVDEGCDELKEAVANSTISMNDAYEIALNYGDDEEKQKEYLEKCKNIEWGNKGVLIKEIKGIIPSINNEDSNLANKKRENYKKISVAEETLMHVYMEDTVTYEDVKKLVKICKKFYKKYKAYDN